MANTQLSAPGKTKHKIDKNNLKLLAVAGALFILMSILRPKLFLSPLNLRAMAVQLSEFGFFALAMMVSFLSGGTNLANVAVANLTSVIVARVFLAAIAGGVPENHFGFMVALAFVIAIGLGAVLGTLSGFIIARFGLPAMLVTMGVEYFYMGLALVVTKGKPITGFPAAVTEFGNGTLLGIPIPLIVFLALVVVTWVILNRTKFGFDVKLLGTNEHATRYSGIRVFGVYMKTYILCGVISAIGGVMMLARSNTARAEYGTSYVFSSILCVVLGGIDFGVGKISGLLLALVSLQFLSSGFNMLQMSSVLKDFIWGLLLLGVMAMNHFLEVRALKKGVNKA